jgi:hypothetical protein
MNQLYYYNIHYTTRQQEVFSCSKNAPITVTEFCYLSQNLKMYIKITINFASLDSVHGSTVNRKIERLPYDLLQNLSEDIFRKIDNHYTEKNLNDKITFPQKKYNSNLF